MPNDPERWLGPRLDPEERLIWVGQPRQGVRLRASDAVVIPFSLLWVGLAITITVGISVGSRSMLPGLFGFPFILVGFYLLAGRF
jgi:hypothetical protein